MLGIGSVHDGTRAVHGVSIALVAPGRGLRIRVERFATGVLRIVGGILQPDREVPGAAELLAVQEQSVDDEDRVGPSCQPARFDALIALRIERCGHETGGAAHPERADQRAPERLNIERVRRALGEGFGAARLARRERGEEVDGARAKGFPPGTAERLGELVREGGVSCGVDPVDHRDHPTFRPVVAGLLDERIHHRAPLGYPPRHGIESTLSLVDIAALLAEWYPLARRELPWRRPDFGAWGVLVSEFMLQQTQVSRVIPRLEEWLARWPTPAALAASPAAEAIRAWDRLGYPRRALALHAAATAIVERHGGVVPSDVDALLALPGVGPYTARAVAVFAYGMRHPVVDTNVRRVLARVVEGRAEAGPPSTARDLAAMEAVLPEDTAASVVVNAATMELGAIVCTARAPRCEACPLAGGCAWRAAEYPPLPASAPRRARQARYAGSDRQARGALLRMLRASELPVSEAELAEALPDAARRARVLDGLVRDGLLARGASGYTLPD